MRTPIYKCRYEFVSIENPTNVELEIETETPEKAYREFLDKVKVRQIPVIVSWFFGSIRKEYFDNHIQNGQGEKRLATNVDRLLKEKEKNKQVEAKQAAQSSLSSTDVLLKELIKEQKQTNEWLKKVRWSLLGINVIMVLWYVFGWVIYPI